MHLLDMPSSGYRGLPWDLLLTEQAAMFPGASLRRATNIQQTDVSAIDLAIAPAVVKTPLHAIVLQEVNKFEEAFKDPKFMELFADYAKEISDPANKAETEAYLRQVESQGRAEEVYGKGTQLVVPEAAFVLKTRDKASGQKIFINVCTSDKVRHTAGLFEKPLLLCCCQHA